MSKSHFGMHPARLEEIEVRLIGAHSRPWMAVPPVGIVEGLSSRCMVATSFKQIELEEEDLNLVAIESSALMAAIDTGFSTKSMDLCEFVAHAPQDIEDLIREVRALSHRNATLESHAEALASSLRDVTEERDKLKRDLSVVVGAWKALNKIGEWRAIDEVAR